VTDRGAGPEDPYAGLRPRLGAPEGRGGYGLWLTNELVAATMYTRDRDGFTIHLVGGRALPLHHDAGPAG
jgi:anti-sigma regulatory factor (Ser/Thr protein kinase)